jgi:arsenate reductase
MAEAFFNHFAGKKARAISAGSHPAEEVNPIIIKVMDEVGINIHEKKPKLLTLDMMEGIEKAVTMGCENTCPVTTVETEDWALEDPQGKPIEKVREIRDQIKSRVLKLIEQMFPDIRL